MSAADVVGLIRLVIAGTGIGLNLATGLLLHHYRRDLRGRPLTHFERRSFNLSLRTGAVRAAEHLAYMALAVRLILSDSAISWPSLLLMAIQVAVTVNDVQVARAMRENMRQTFGRS